MFSRNVTLITLLCAVAILLIACGSDSEPSTSEAPFYTRVGEVTLAPGDEIPVPTGNAVLTVRGDIGTTNVDDTVEMDTTTLESIGQVEYRVTDPFLEESILFRGVLMSELLDVLQVGEGATELEMRALNDYTVTVPIEEVTQYPVLFAMQQNGEYMPISDRGPAMLVFPYDNFEFDHNVYENYWIWQIAEITVK